MPTQQSQMTSCQSLNRKSQIANLKWCIPLFFLLHLAYAALHQLAPDEAYYWVWSRHLSLGYFDHPPMVAWLIKLSTLLFGSTEFGVRLPAVLLSVGIILILTRLARHLSPNSRASSLTLLILLTSPILAVLASIITPDTPAYFFASAALAFALLATHTPSSSSPLSTVYCLLSTPLSWLLFGLFTGLALLSKYTTILLPASVFLALLSSPTGRSHLRRPWFWLAALVALLVFSPVIYWNYTHDWASFRFQLNHGVGEADEPAPFLNIVGYIASQFLLFTPILFLLALPILLNLFRTYRRLPLTRQILLIASCLPIFFFAFSSLRHRPEMNWPAFAYLPLTLLLALVLSESPSPKRDHWLRIGLIIALVMTLSLQFLPDIIIRTPIKPPSKFAEIYGWRELASHVDSLRNGAPVHCNTYQYASELSFYLPGQPDVWSLNLGSRPNAFDYFPNKPDLSTLPRLFLVTNYKSTRLPPDLLAPYFPSRHFTIYPQSLYNHPLRSHHFTAAEK